MKNFAPSWRPSVLVQFEVASRNGSGLYFVRRTGDPIGCLQNYLYPATILVSVDRACSAVTAFAVTRDGKLP